MILLYMSLSPLCLSPFSLSNLDQDLPNSMIHNVPIKSLPQDWLWCETWCSMETKPSAKTIDLVRAETINVHFDLILPSLSSPFLLSLLLPPFLSLLLPSFYLSSSPSFSLSLLLPPFSLSSSPSLLSPFSLSAIIP